jgi:hypothetical protein
MALDEVVWIGDEEFLLRAIPLKGGPSDKFIDDGKLSSQIFSDRGKCPSVHMATHSNIAALVKENPMRFCFAVITAEDVRRWSLGEVIHNPTDDHYSHALVVPYPRVYAEQSVQKMEATPFEARVGPYLYSRESRFFSHLSWR